MPFSHWDNNISELSPFVDAICLVIGPKSKLLVHSAAYSAASRSTKKWLSSCRSARGERHQITMNWTNEGCSAGHVPGIFQLIWFSKKHSMVLNPNQACQSYVTLFKNSYKDLDLAWFHLAWFHGDVSAEIHEKMTPHFGDAPVTSDRDWWMSGAARPQYGPRPSMAAGANLKWSNLMGQWDNQGLVTIYHMMYLNL